MDRYRTLTDASYLGMTSKTPTDAGGNIITAFPGKIILLLLYSASTLLLDVVWMAFGFTARRPIGNLCATSLCPVFVQYLTNTKPIQQQKNTNTTAIEYQ